MVWGADESAPLEYFDDDRPQYHVQPPAGWMNDPNGPIYHKGRYHMYALIYHIFEMIINRRISCLRGGPQQMVAVGVREGSGRGQLLSVFGRNVSRVEDTFILNVETLAKQ